MRFKYPFIVDGALAASAPIFQVAGIVSGQVFWKGVTTVKKKIKLKLERLLFFLKQDYTTSNPMCPVKVRQAFSEILEYKQNSTGEGQ